MDSQENIIAIILDRVLFLIAGVGILYLLQLAGILGHISI